MDQIVFESVRKIFRHRPALFNWLGRERGGETVALNDVSFSAASGEVLVLLGPNGSGKTTALKLISTNITARCGVGARGRLRCAARCRCSPAAGWHRGATERSFFPRLSARENLEFFAALDEVSRTERVPRIAEFSAMPGSKSKPTRWS